MMRPLRCLIIGLSTACTLVNAAVRFVWMTASQSSRFIRSISVSRVMPALFTRMSMRPLPAMMAATAASTPAASVTSSPIDSADPPASRIASAVPLAFSPRAAATTCAPAAARRVATARPMPRDAPVTRATRPERFAIDNPATSAHATRRCKATCASYAFSVLASRATMRCSASRAVVAMPFSIACAVDRPWPTTATPFSPSSSAPPDSA